MKFVSKLRIPKTTKQVKRLIGFVQHYRDFIPNLGEKFLPFYKLLKKDTVFIKEDTHYKGIEAMKNDLLTATTLTLRMTQTEKQFVILYDASFHSAGFVLMIEDFHQDKRETEVYAPVTFGSQLFNKAQLKLSIYCKEFLALFFAVEAFSHYIWRADKP